jgi:hypothetical protein
MFAEKAREDSGNSKPLRKEREKEREKREEESNDSSRAWFMPEQLS